MPLINRDTDYALRALINIAKKGDTRYCSATDIAQQENITPQFTRKILQKLVRAGVVGSRRGPKGGFYLMRKPSEITVHCVFDTVQGKFEVSRCILDPKLCQRSGACIIRKKLMDLQTMIIDYFKGATLANLLEDNMPYQN
jgi:Rrf2 family transcriptional regulator, iron-sulfur cluster assembly transcription factor